MGLISKREQRLIKGATSHPKVRQRRRLPWRL